MRGLVLRQIVILKIKDKPGQLRQARHLCRGLYAQYPDHPWYHFVSTARLRNREQRSGRALLIIAIANVITILTSQSLAAIATNLKVKGGGDYYLISRTLGMEFGGAIGIVLYLAQSVSVAFYCIGFATGMARQ